MDIDLSDCTLCSLHKTAQFVGLVGRGPAPCRVLIVGEAPGRREDDVGKPFQGPAGRLLDQVMQEVGLNRSEIYITNAVRCRPPDNRTPTRGEIKACSGHMQTELEHVNPEHVLVLGSVALRALLNKSGVMKLRGKIFRKSGVNYFVTMHPAAVIRQQNLLSVFRADLKRFKKLTEGTLNDDHQLNMTLVNSKIKLRECINKLAKADAVAYDLETSGFNPRSRGAKIYVLGLATDTDQYVIPLDYPGSAFQGQGQAITNLLRKVLGGKKLVAHNSKFDNKWLFVLYGWDVHTTFDTMMASYILDENRKHGLKDLSKIMYQAPQYEIEQPVDPSQVPLEKLARYNAFDVYFTMKLYRDFREELIKDKRLLKVFVHLIMPAIKLIENIELHGVYVDRERYSELVPQLHQELDDLENELNSLAGRKLNWNSPTQVGILLFHDLGLNPLELTKTGKPSTSESVLLRLRDEHPVIPLLLKYREKVKLAQFLKSWGEHMDPRNRMHPRFLLHGTVTGRLSCRDPNLQQVPRDPILRSLITAPEGKILVEADYSQIELRVAAMVSRDETMKRAYQTGQDIHRTTASAVMGVAPEYVDKDKRKKAKAVNFGFLYGMGSRKFQQYARDKFDVDLSPTDAEDFRERFFELFPDLLTWHERSRRIVRKYGYIRNPIGRKRRLPDINSNDRYLQGEAERQAINSPVQSFASDLTLAAATRLRAHGLQVVGLVHDAILLEIDCDKLDEAVALIRKTMEEDIVEWVEEKFDYALTVPMQVEIKVGPWGGGEVV